MAAGTVGGGAMLAMDMGTGKSKVVVDLIVNFGFTRTLIIAPKSVVNVWPNQFRTHAGRPVTVVALSTGSVAQRAKQAKEAYELAGVQNEPLVLVINYESAWRSAFAEFALSVEWDLVVLDESHRIKAPRGKASMFCAQLGTRAKHRLALTGTPMPHSPLDAFAQYRFLDPSVFGTSFVRFRNRYAVMGGYGGHEVVGFQNEDELNEKFYSRAYRVTKDVLDLPPVVHTTRTCTLSATTRRLYNQLETNFWAEVESGEVTAANALTKLLRLQQVTCGFVRDDEGNTTQVGTEKRELLADVLEDIPADEPVVVFARFQNDLDTIREVAEAQGRRYGELSGRRNDLTANSTMPEDIDLLAVQIQAGGVGVDLTRARYVVYYSLGFSLGDYEQSLARSHRPGQERTVTYIHLLAEGTVDERVYTALKNRKEVVQDILERGRA